MTLGELDFKKHGIFGTFTRERWLWWCALLYWPLIFFVCVSDGFTNNIQRVVLTMVLTIMGVYLWNMVNKMFHESISTKDEPCASVLCSGDDSTNTSTSL